MVGIVVPVLADTLGFLILVWYFSAGLFHFSLAVTAASLVEPWRPGRDALILAGCASFFRAIVRENLIMKRGDAWRQEDEE